MIAPADFDTDIALTPEQWVIKHLRARLVERCGSLVSGTTEMGVGMFVGYDAAIGLLDALCESQGVTA